MDEDDSCDTGYFLPLLGVLVLLPILSGLVAWMPPNTPGICRAEIILHGVLLFPLQVIHFANEPVRIVYLLLFPGFVLVSLRSYINWKYFYSIVAGAYIIICFIAAMTKVTCPGYFDAAI